MITKITNRRGSYQCWLAAYVSDKTLKSVSAAFDSAFSSPDFPETTFNGMFMEDAKTAEEMEDIFQNLQDEGWIEFEEDQDSIVVKFMEDGGDVLEDIVLRDEI